MLGRCRLAPNLTGAHLPGEPSKVPADIGYIHMAVECGPWFSIDIS
jgi:hypothetical protein